MTVHTTHHKFSGLHPSYFRSHYLRHKARNKEYTVVSVTHPRMPHNYRHTTLVTQTNNSNVTRVGTGRKLLPGTAREGAQTELT